MSYSYNLFVSIDQLANTLAGGNPDNTISARIGYHMSRDDKPKWYWRFFEKIVNFSFYPVDGKDHCKQAYQADSNERFDYKVNTPILLILSFSILIPCTFISLFLYVLYFFGIVSPTERKKIEEEKIYTLIPSSKSIDDRDPYLRKLAKVLYEEKDVTNIALTGRYGSGKSSIIKKFKSIYADFKYLDISLAYFGESNPEEEDDQKQSIINQLEHAIVQQIIFRESANNLPFSNFLRLKSYSSKKIAILSICSVIWLLSFANIFFSKFYEGVIPSIEGTFNAFDQTIKTQSFIDVMYGLIFLGGTYYLLQKIYTKFLLTSIKKISLTKGEIELHQEKSSSVLNQYIDEIIYFFKTTNCNVVILEDIDRFNKIEIFSKLREINFMINRSKEINQKVVFLYAVKDSLFKKEEDRTKFFDFILPVIPHVNTSNAEAIFLEELGLKVEQDENQDSQDEVLAIEDNHEKKRLKDLISEISLYITDNRMVNSILNEYDVYKKKLKSNGGEEGHKISLDNAKLLALVAYKNLKPEDYQKMSLRQGILNEILSKKLDFREQILEKYEHDLSVLRSEETDEHFQKKLIHLKSPYLLEYLNSNSNYALSVQRGHTSSVLYNDKIFSDWVKGGQYFSKGYGIPKFKEIEEKVGGIPYLERKKQLELEHESLSPKIKRLQEKIGKIKHYELKDCVNESSISILLNKEFEGSSFLVTLLRYGYVEEDYTLYMNYFRDGSLTMKDQNFIIDVKSRKPNAEYDEHFKLDNIDLVIRKLRPDDLKTISCINHQILYNLVKNGENEKLESLLQYIIELDDKSKVFKVLKSIIDNDGKSFLNEKERNELFRTILILWENFWGDIVKYTPMPTNQDTYLIQILTSVDEKGIAVLNNQESFKRYLNESPNLTHLNSLNGHQEKIFNILESLDIKFSALHLFGTTLKTLADNIYASNRYVLNKHMIAEWIKYYNPKLKDLITFSSRKIAVDQKRIQNLPELHSYIETKLDTYFEEIYLLYNHEDIENTEAEYFINHKGLNLELKQSFIEQKRFLIDFEKVTEKRLFSLLLEYDRVTIDWTNILDYYHFKKDMLDQSLVGFLNRNYLSLQAILEDGNTNLGIAIFTCDDLNIDAYEFYIPLFKEVILNSPNQFRELSEEKVTKLLENDRLELNNDIVDYIFHNSSFENFLLVLKKNGYQVLSKYTLDEDQYYTLLQEDLTLGNLKIILILLSGSHYLRKSQKLSDIVFKVFLAQKSLLEEHYAEFKIALEVSSSKEKSEVIYDVVDHLNNSQLVELLRLLDGEPWTTIQEGAQKRNITIDKDKDLRLLKRLHEKNVIIASINEKDKTVNLKQDVKDFLGNN